MCLYCFFVPFNRVMNGSRHWASLVNSEKENNLATIIMKGQSTTCSQKTELSP